MMTEPGSPAKPGRREPEPALSVFCPPPSATIAAAAHRGRQLTRRTPQMIGAELEQMQGLRASLDRNGTQVAEVARSIRGQLAGTFWRGPAADRFRQAWDGEFEPALRRLQEALGEAGQEVQRRHDALQQAGG